MRRILHPVGQLFQERAAAIDVRPYHYAVGHHRQLCHIVDKVQNLVEVKEVKVRAGRDRQNFGQGVPVGGGAEQVAVQQGVDFPMPPLHDFERRVFALAVGA